LLPNQEKNGANLLIENITKSFETILAIVKITLNEKSSIINRKKVNPFTSSEDEFRNCGKNVETIPNPSSGGIGIILKQKRTKFN
jgi:hypothetical protein